MELDIATKDECIQSINKSGNLSRHYFSLKIDTTLEKLASNVKIFGEIIKETKPSDIPFEREKDKQALLNISVLPKSIDNLKLTLVQSITTFSGDVRGRTMLPGGRMVFTCYHPSHLTVVNQDGSKGFRIDLGCSFDVIYISDNNIAVTSGYSTSNIKITDTKWKKVTKRLNVGSSKDGIALKDNDLIYCGREAGLKKINLSDDSVRKIVQSRLVDFSYVTTCNDNIIYTENNTNTVTCTNMQGQVNWKFKDESILVHPLGISVDKAGNMYVIGRDICNLIVISPDGQQHRQILSAKDGLRNPSVLHFDLVTIKLLVAKVREKAFLYDVSS